MSDEDTPSESGDDGIPAAVSVLAPAGCPGRVRAAAREGVWRVLCMEGMQAAEVCVYLTDDAEIAELNTAYRHRCGPTDVLAFSQCEHIEGEPSTVLPAEPEPVLGDVVISLDTASRQACERGAKIEDEVRELAAHGTLHLLGHDDETEEGAEQMRELARRALRSPASAADNDGQQTHLQ